MTTLEKAICRPAVLPYFAEPDTYPSDIFLSVYAKLAAEGLLGSVFCDYTPTPEQFDLFMRQDCLAFLLMDMDTNQYVGLSWLAMVEDGGAVKRASANFVFFLEFQFPVITDQFGKMLLSHFFNVLGFDIIWGITPAVNVASVRYCKRIGFEESGRLRNWTNYQGALSDAVIFAMAKESFQAKLE